MTTNTKKTSPFTRESIWILRICMGGAIIGISLFGSKKLMDSGPKHARKPIGERVAVVETVSLERQNQAVTVEATGIVKASRSLNLNTRVNGNITSINSLFEPGSKVKAGTPLVELDPADFKLNVEKSEITVAKAESSLLKAQSDVVTAEYQYKIELGQQDIASYEWEQIVDRESIDELDRELILRKPHLLKAEADVKSAQASLHSAQVEVKNANASLAQAKLDLERTVIKAPFDAVIGSRTISEGMEINTQTQLGTLISTKECWIEASIPYSNLGWVELPEKDLEGSQVIISQSGNAAGTNKWKGRVIGLRPELEANGRRARILISVSRPFDGKEPLLINSFVNVSIQGKTLENIFSIPRKAVQEGSIVWLLNNENRLEFRAINPLWSNKRNVYVESGLTAGEMLITTDIASAVPQMKLQTVEEAAKSIEKQERKKPGKRFAGNNKERAE